MPGKKRAGCHGTSKANTQSGGRDSRENHDKGRRDACKKSVSTLITAEPEALREKELIQKNLLRSGVNKRDGKPVTEAIRAELGETLASGRELQLPPLGHVMMNRHKDARNGKGIITKIHQKNAMKLTSTAAKSRSLVRAQTATGGRLCWRGDGSNDGLFAFLKILGITPPSKRPTGAFGVN